MKTSPYHWHCDQCGWDSKHSDIPHSVMCFAMNPSALKSRPVRKTTAEEYENLFKEN